MEVFKAKLKEAIRALEAMENAPWSMLSFSEKAELEKDIEKKKNDIRLLKKAIEIGASLDNSVTYTFEVV
jgi:hypothetical protein